MAAPDGRLGGSNTSSGGEHRMFRTLVAAIVTVSALAFAQDAAPEDIAQKDDSQDFPIAPLSGQRRRDGRSDIGGARSCGRFQAPLDGMIDQRDVNADSLVPIARLNTRRIRLTVRGGSNASLTSRCERVRKVRLFDSEASSARSSPRRFFCSRPRPAQPSRMRRRRPIPRSRFTRSPVSSSTSAAASSIFDAAVAERRPSCSKRARCRIR